MIITDKKEQKNNIDKLTKELSKNLESKLFPELLDRFQTFSIFISDNGDIAVFDTVNFDYSSLKKLTSQKTGLLSSFYFKQFYGYSSEEWEFLKDHIVSDFFSFKLKKNFSNQKDFF